MDDDDNRQPPLDDEGQAVAQDDRDDDGAGENNNIDRNDQDNNNNNNNNLMVDDEDDDDGNGEEQDGEEQQQEEDEEEEEEETTLDGGVAMPTEDDPDNKDNKEKTHSTDCDLVLYFYCEQPIDWAPDHPIMRPGICVSIGLDKTTKLWSVFQRYVDFCNQSAEGSGNDAIEHEELEFVHSQILTSEHTAEYNALMKNDRILVRKHQLARREYENEVRKLEREADRNFVVQMRSLMPMERPRYVSHPRPDVILDCRGKLIFDGQRLLDTTVRVHSFMIRKRCPWLADIIEKARIEQKKEGEKDDNEDDCDSPSDKDTPGDLAEEDSPAAEVEDDTHDDGSDSSGDDEDEFPGNGANKIEDDDGDEADGQPPVEEEMSDDALSSPMRRQPTKAKKLLVAKIPDHSREAIKLLLEYCYTNRVVSLGHDAFVQSCKTRPSRNYGPVSPIYHISARRWPNNGFPTITLHEALDGIALADKAKLPRLSLMCEIAASQLVDLQNYGEALAWCSIQNEASGNDHPRVRKACMELIFKNKTMSKSQFLNVLADHRHLIIPTLMKGTAELVLMHEKKKKDTTILAENKKYLSSLSFHKIDRDDRRARAEERRYAEATRYAERRARQSQRVLSDEGATLHDAGLSGWAQETAKRSLKRLAQHNIEPVAGRRTRRRQS